MVLNSVPPLKSGYNTHCTVLATSTVLSLIPLLTLVPVPLRLPPLVSFAGCTKPFFFGADQGTVLRRGSNGGLPRQMGGRPCLTVFFVFSYFFLIFFCVRKKYGFWSFTGSLSIAASDRREEGGRTCCRKVGGRGVWTVKTASFIPVFIFA